MIVSGIKGILIYYGSGCQISQASLYDYGYVIPLWPWICNILFILKGPLSSLGVSVSQFYFRSRYIILLRDGWS